MTPRIYTYKVTFEEVPYWYWGVHKEKKFGEVYLGSPKTHKWAWTFYTPKVQILELFDYSQEGWSQAKKVEKRLIGPDLNNSLCLNESCNGDFSIGALKRGGEKGGKVVGKLNRENGHMSKIQVLGGTVQGRRNAIEKTGVCGRTTKKMREDGTKGGTTQGRRNAENKTGFCNPDVQRANGLKCVENKIGIHSDEYRKSGVMQERARKLGSLPWWVNAKNETTRNSVCPGEGWIRGRKWKEISP
jgi:hypothetical protein